MSKFARQIVTEQREYDALMDNIRFGRAPQTDARNSEFALWNELTQQDRDYAMQIPKKTYWRPNIRLTYQYRTDAIVACAFWNAMSMQGIKPIPAVTVGSLHRMSRAHYMMLGGDPAVGSSSLLSCARALRDFKLIDRYVWEYDIDGIMAWLLLGRGPVIIGCTLYGHMLYPKGVARTVTVGGPALGDAALVIYKADRVRGIIGIATSWERIHRFEMRCEDVDLLLRKSDAEIVAIVGV